MSGSPTAPEAGAAAAAQASRGGGQAVEIRYRRLPDDVRTYRQELLQDGDEVKITLHRVQRAEAPLEVGEAPPLGAGATLLWFSFPGRPFEVASLYDPEGRLVGNYTNLVRPAELRGRRWELTDLWLDLWQPVGGAPRILDEDELREAEAAGRIEPREAEEARRRAQGLLRKAWAGAWPPGPVGRWGAEDVPSLRLRRDAPGSYYAHLVSTRVIAYGMYLLGGVSLTTLGMSLVGDPFHGVLKHVWAALLGSQALLLLPLALAGKLPATRRASLIRSGRPMLNERGLFVGTAAAGIAVLFLNESRLWSELLLGLYGALALFLTIFATCRLRFDRKMPILAFVGLLACAIAFTVLL